MKTFKSSKKIIVERASRLNACTSQLNRAENATTLDELISVCRDNAGWCRENKLFTDEESINMFGLSISNLFNSGYRNSGDRNSGDRNSGDRNSGDSNSGDRNSGNWNSGDRNSGDSNSGDSNSGDSNSGDRNSGNWNSGDRNSGYRNSGDRNSGDRNSGDRNSGDRNSGNWNSGDRNSGDSNSGYRNSGAFCTDPAPKMILFNKPCKTMTVRQWEQTRACQLMNNIDPTIWVPGSMMSDEEKSTHPKWETTDGYLKTIPMKEAWTNFWGNLNDKDKAEFTNIENFDPLVFQEITGILIF